MTINCIHTTTRGTHICFQTIVIYTCSFTHDYDNTFWTSFFLHNIPCFTRECVFNIHGSHFWARDNPCAIHERGYQVRFGVSIWALIVRDISRGPLFATWQADCWQISWFFKPFYLGSAWVVLLAVEQLWFQHDGAPAQYGEDVRQWLIATYPGRWIGRGRPTAWPPWLPHLTPMFFFSVGTHLGVRLRRPSQDYRISRGKTTSSWDNGRCQHVKALLFGSPSLRTTFISYHWVTDIFTQMLQY
jgi:hypothetical protein